VAVRPEELCLWFLDRRHVVSSSSKCTNASNQSEGFDARGYCRAGGGVELRTRSGKKRADGA
jgi:hypothetical protein